MRTLDGSAPAGMREAIEKLRVAETAPASGARPIRLGLPCRVGTVGHAHRGDAE